jgi:predicted nucleic acid-binding protein
MAGVVVLDAGALIALHSSRDPHHRWALSMFSETIAFDLAMNALTYAEVLVHPTKAGQQAKFEKSVGGLGIVVGAISEKDASAIAELRVKTNLKMPDAVVLHEAIKSGAAVATTDKLLAAHARKLSLGVFQPS